MILLNQTPGIRAGSAFDPAHILWRVECGYQDPQSKCPPVRRTRVILVLDQASRLNERIVPGSVRISVKSSVYSPVPELVSKPREGDGDDESRHHGEQGIAEGHGHRLELGPGGRVRKLA